MESLSFSIIVAVWLGILTSISPCPLATNIAAISYIGRRVDNTYGIFLSGLFYTLGRMMMYTILGVLIVTSVLSVPSLSHFLQKYMNKILGPVLILAGMVLLGLLSFYPKGGGISEGMQKRIDKMGILGALVLGMIFALSFCPPAAALFFGSLVPLAIKHRSILVLPCFYGLGTALPVIVFALALGMSTHALGKMFNRLKSFELWTRHITGIIFILLGIYLSLKYIYRI